MYYCATYIYLYITCVYIYIYIDAVYMCTCIYFYHISYNIFIYSSYIQIFVIYIHIFIHHMFIFCISYTITDVLYIYIIYHVVGTCNRKACDVLSQVGEGLEWIYIYRYWCFLVSRPEQTAFWDMLDVIIAEWLNLKFGAGFSGCFLLCTSLQFVQSPGHLAFCFST